jgi:hypothetical protein
MAGCDIIIDTNQVLHFRRIDEIDWCALAGCSPCTIVITPILLRELEQKKIFSPSASLKDRARRMSDYLVEQAALPDPIRLRENVTLAFAEHEPAIDFAAHKLVRDVNDDHFIAAALERQAVSGLRTFIASNDGGMALKLRSRPIDVLRLPETLALPAEVDAEQKELRDAKREIARLKSQRPKLSLSFADGSAKCDIRSPRTIELDAPDFAQITMEHPMLPIPAAEGAAPFTGDLSSLRNVGRLHGSGSRERIERYNDELREFWSQYQGYLKKLEAWAEVSRLTTELAFKLHNDGSATATDVDITIRFPQSVLLHRFRGFPKRPEAPEPPSKPGTLGAAMGRSWRDPHVSFPDYLGTTLDFHDGSAFIDEENRQTVSYSVRSLKQKCEFHLDAFLLTRAPDLNGKGIEIDVSITYHEGEPIHHKLAMTFRDEDAVSAEG